MDMTLTQELLAAATVSDPRWAAVQARDAQADGNFFYSVKTTGVYCRPSCAARPARPENVAFHLTAQDAERAGFRPCKRCKPDQAQSPAEQQASLVAQLCRFIDSALTQTQAARTPALRMITATFLPAKAGHTPFCQT